MNAHAKHADLASTSTSVSGWVPLSISRFPSDASVPSPVSCHLSNSIPGGGGSLPAGNDLPLGLSEKRRVDLKNFAFLFFQTPCWVFFGGEPGLLSLYGLISSRLHCTFLLHLLVGGAGCLVCTIPVQENENSRPIALFSSICLLVVCTIPLCSGINIDSRLRLIRGEE